MSLEAIAPLLLILGGFIITGATLFIRKRGFSDYHGKYAALRVNQSLTTAQKTARKEMLDARRKSFSVVTAFLLMFGIGLTCGPVIALIISYSSSSV